MAILSRADIRQAMRISKLLDKATHESTSEVERAAYSAKAAELAGRYEHGGEMTYDGRSISETVTRADPPQ